MSYIDMSILTEEQSKELGLRKEGEYRVRHEDFTGHRSFTDGEELMAATNLMNLLEQLENGEVIVVSVDYF